jgi:hypothetical protein
MLSSSGKCFDGTLREEESMEERAVEASLVPRFRRNLTRLIGL